ncbi:glycoside hydrolase family 25 protein [Neolewinella antarctica]|uniref:Lysozyme n=1 Tax=Neolewinella antarctica TaxID=442734 RepID=A0ABX0XEG6_9BACT|nr:GH25 family lysozyme [Neolewinella antarctica]NJC27612.1 lysozyme [Neolewinella antarctica]
MGFTACSSAPHDADRYATVGLDVSHYQGLIDWGDVSHGNHDFVFMKATEGRSLRDKAFLYNWQKAGEQGLRRGAYHFFRPSVPAAEQARLYFNTVDLRPGDLPPVLDVEKIGRLTGNQLVSAIREWSEMAELRYGVKPIIYTGQNFYNNYLAGRIDDHHLWLARYDNEQPVTVCGRSYQFWQYSDRGRSRGIQGRVDKNVFTGTTAEWAALPIPLPGASPDYPEVLEERTISQLPRAKKGMDDLVSFGVIRR